MTQERGLGSDQNDHRAIDRGRGLEGVCVNPRQRYNMLYTQTVVFVPHYVKETRKKRTRDRDRPIASRTLDRARGRDERQRTDDVERRGGASGRDGDGGGGARETTRRRGGLEGDARERGGKTGAVIGVGL